VEPTGAAVRARGPFVNVKEGCPPVTPRDVKSTVKARAGETAPTDRVVAVAANKATENALGNAVVIRKKASKPLLASNQMRVK
jgi:hypothetical protein